MKTRVRARIVGRVQGVGFRPTVYRYATQLGLGGFVRNDPQGVTIEVEGEDGDVDAFFDQLTAAPPRQAVIETIETQSLGEKGYQQFAVIDSDASGAAAVHISPDLATCPDCLREMFAAADRRFAYPFINCTNCGPRFTIIRDLPYDRARTAMAGFTMCPRCATEYHDPRDRRFQAQPDACAECGPVLEWKDGRVEGWKPDNTQSSNLPASQSAVLAEAVAGLRSGRIVAVKGLGGYHLACDATNAAAVALLRERKHRPHKPLAVMFRDLETVKRFCEVSEAEEAELLSVARPIVVLRRREGAGWEDGKVGRMEGWKKAEDQPSPLPPFHSSLSPDSGSLGAFLPYTPLHHLLLQDLAALVMTSGNRTDEPIISDEEELPALLGPVADAALTHNRPIAHKCDDSVLRVVNGQRQFIRRARGFAPNPIRLAADSAHLLAVGGELKNTFCLVRDGYAFLSQHLGDLNEYSTYEYFAHEIAEWQRLMRVNPVAIAHDLHPDYRSTRWAKEWNGGRMEEWKKGVAQPASLPSFQSPLLIPVQHHHAHIASVLGEHERHEPVIGVALDGTGYGPDGTVWGGEFLVADRVGFERVAHFKQYRLPGGDKAVVEPWRMAASVAEAEGMEEWKNGRMGISDLPLFHSSILPLIHSGFNSPLTSSAGRLFDAVAALLGLGTVTTYEAQAAVRLEAVADPRVTTAYEFLLEADRSPWVLNFGPALRTLVAEQQRGEAVATIAARFHNTVAAAIVAICGRLRGQRDLNSVALSGGVFQNELLLRRTVAALRARHFVVLTNTVVPPNDGGLAFGQAVVAAARMGATGDPAAAGSNGVQGQSRTRLGMQAETLAQPESHGSPITSHQSPITTGSENRPSCV